MLQDHQIKDRQILLKLADEAVSNGFDIDLRHESSTGFHLQIQSCGVDVSFERLDAAEYDGGPWKARLVGRPHHPCNLVALKSMAASLAKLAEWAEQALRQLQADDARRKRFHPLTPEQWQEAASKENVFRTVDGGVVVPLRDGSFMVSTPGRGAIHNVSECGKPVELVPEDEVPSLLIQCSDLRAEGEAAILCATRRREATRALLPELAQLLETQGHKNVQIGAMSMPFDRPVILVNWSSTT
jgi:hypothetical protein